MTKPITVLALWLTPVLSGQSTPESLARALSAPIQAPEVVNYQLRRYVRRLVKPLAVPATARDWTAQAARLRSRVLNEVVFHGWPDGWVNSPPRFEDAGTIPTQGPYRLRKLRYEIVPGFWSVALVYEPLEVKSRVPAILSVNGHEPIGKAEEYIQKRCINQALQGMVMLHPDWINTGELQHAENAHWFGAHIDLAGANALGLFYLAMRRGLDYLCARPDVDAARIGITGLSGGGWQSIVLGALDERIAVSVPVAGYLPSVSYGGYEHAGDNEQTAADFAAAVDYDVLTAMRAPRPTLLVYNAEDNCCFRAPRMKPDLYDAVLPFFNLYGKEAVFVWHENLDPGTHNYQIENRMAAYRFFARYFGIPDIRAEVPADGWIKSAEELRVGVPQGQLTLPGVARELAKRIHRDESVDPAAARERLRSLVRFRERPLDRVWIAANSKSRGVETRSYRFDFADGLTATGVWVKAIAQPDTGTATIVLHDGGREASASQVSERVNRGERVLTLELLLTGDAAPPKFGYPDHDRMLVTLGERSLGLRVSQLLTASRWLAAQSGVEKVRLETAGMRSQLAALVARALEPKRFSAFHVRDGIESLAYLLNKPVPYQEAPEMFCLDLLAAFDIDSLRRIGDPASR